MFRSKFTTMRTFEQFYIGVLVGNYTLSGVDIPCPMSDTMLYKNDLKLTSNLNDIHQTSEKVKLERI